VRRVIADTSQPAAMHITSAPARLRALPALLHRFGAHQVTSRLCVGLRLPSGHQQLAPFEFSIRLNEAEPAGLNAIAPVATHIRPLARYANFSAALLFALPYMLLLVWFHGVDVYHRHFSQLGLIVFAYNCFRLLFIFYLFWMVETVGLWLLRIVAGKTLAHIATLERLVLGFFTGAGVWHLAMLVLGYLNLYTFRVAVIMSLPLVVLSYADVRTFSKDAYRAFASGSAIVSNIGTGFLGWLLFGLACGAFIVLLLIKGLFPGGGHDYFTHYFYYYQSVIAHQGLSPNDVWYHYYYDKGAGLYFLGILITDPLAPQLITFTFFATGLTALLVLLRRIAPDTLWPLAGVVLFLVIYIYTPGSAFIYIANGGWGEFEKPHEIVASLVIAIVWMTIQALSEKDRLQVLWSVGAAAAIICAVIVDDTIAVFLGGTMALLALFYAAQRHIAQFLVCISLGAVAGFVLVCLLTINQLTTGLASDQGVLVFWNFADAESLARWGALPLVIKYYLDSVAMAASSLPLSQTAKFLIDSLRVEYFYPLIVGGIIVTAPAIFRRHWNRKLVTETAVIIAALIVFVGLAIVVGRAQQISFYRYATFATALTLSTAMLLWARPLDSPRSWPSRIARDRRTTAIVLLICLAGDIYPTQTLRALGRALGFASGRYSIDNAYTMQYGRVQSGIYPGSRGAYQGVGPDTPIWSFHVHTYCMLPDCKVETYFSFIMTRDWDRVMFGQPEEAKRALQAANLNYFLFTREDSITDPLPLSPLFTPDNIGSYLGVRWTDGTSILLTWLGPDVQPLTPAWLAEYRQAVINSGTIASFPYAAMKRIFARLHKTPHPWPVFQLP
jgi:hypothetical protein